VKSNAKERPPVAGAGGPGAGAVGREVALEGAGGESLTREWTRGVTFEQPRSTVRLRGEKEGRRGGPAAGVPRGARVVVGPDPDRWAAPGSGPRLAGMHDVRRAIVAGRTEERRRGTDRWAGPRRKEKWADPR
jgi:hypothetical protein